MKRYRLITEYIDSDNFKIFEDETPEKNLYIHGPFLLKNKRNGNQRVYTDEVLDPEVAKFQTLIKEGRAAGELNHPESADINLERISHYIVELRPEGPDWYYGRAKIATTPCGQIVRNLHKDGYKFGVSSRGLGSLTEDNVVEPNFKLITIDIVNNPSCGAFVNGILESKSWIINYDNKYEQLYEEFDKKLKKLPRSYEDYLLKECQNFIKRLSKNQ